MCINNNAYERMIYIYILIILRKMFSLLRYHYIKIRI